MVKLLKSVASAAIVTGLIFTSPSALSSGSANFDVTITNLTNSIKFTPILVASHRKRLSLFELGSPASADMTAIAEGGDISGLTASLNAMSHVVDVLNSGGLLGPGESVTVAVSAAHNARRVSIASMMLPTNDGFIALDSVKAPKKGSATYFSPGYDSGTEPNDELCVNIPGPTCGGVGPSPWGDEDDEGYVHINRGIHGEGDLAAAVYDWRNPVAKITITRINEDD